MILPWRTTSAGPTGRAPGGGRRKTSLRAVFASLARTR